MLRWFYRIRMGAWLLLLWLLIVGLAPWLVAQVGVVDPQAALYVVEPTLAVLAAGLTLYLTGRRSDHVRRKADKSIMIGSVLSVWFVIYFLSGLVLTYVQNAVTSSWLTILVNVMSFGIAAAAVEYARHGIMLMAGRRNVVWFGFIVSAVLAVEQIGLTQLVGLHEGSAMIKFTVSNIMPAIVSSLLLTYLAFTAGYAAQLTFRLGMLAIVLIPPIIPKFDWYLSGVTTCLITIAVYVVIDRSRQDKVHEHRSKHHHSARAYDVMLIIVMSVLVMFMTGFFTYKPLAIVSNSMVPVFSRGSVVVTQKVNSPMDVQVGDILEYKTTQRTITHRVIAIDTTTDGSGERFFITKGDNSPSQDTPVTTDQVVGIVRSQVPYIGYPSIWLKEMVK